MKALAPERTDAVRLFVSYSHKDSFWKDSLLPLLKFRPKVIAQAWTDREIEPGLRPDKEIRRELAQMDIFICLVSPHFAVSDYINDVEMRIARKRLGHSEIEIVPILITKPGGNECDWLLELEYLPDKGRSWVIIKGENPHYDLALQLIRDGIAKVIARVRKKKAKKKK